ncbi:uri1, prefoldin-like chaperone [Coemansia sp. RSA 720]|nr:uri1, prefoldin-like chaperone [Coemansia sp. RSA 720]
MSGKETQPAGPSTSTTTYEKYLDQTTTAVKAALAQYTEYKTEYQQLQQTLRDLPTETEYEAMVPMGPLAFFPGSLINTNEILVLLGDNWFVERSAAQAVEIASRREQFVDAKITATTQELLELERRVELLKLNPASSDVGRELGGDITNELGEKVVDIKEEIGENEPAFADDDLVGGNASSKGKAVDQDAESVQDAMRMKRERMIRALSEPRSASDRSGLSAEDRAMLDALDRIEDDDEEDDEEDDDDEEIEDGDAFSDEDRAYIARDDDEDDFNDNVPEYDDDTSRRMPTSILKSSRREGGRRTKSVSFDLTPTAYETPSHELLDDSNHDEDIDKVTRLIGQLRTAACPAPSSQLISVIGEPSAPRFTPNTAMSGVRKSKQTSAQPQTPQDTQPLRRTVVEHAPHSDPESDNDMHALEIAHAYSQMRQKRMAAGEFDGAAGVADRVLEATPGVTLIDGHVRGGNSDDDVDVDENGFERIELPSGVSESSAESSMTPPEVVCAPRREPVVLSEQVKEAQPNTSVAPKEQVQETQPKPKMSRFKAQRLGLS